MISASQDFNKHFPSELLLWLADKMLTNFTPNQLENQYFTHARLVGNSALSAFGAAKWQIYRKAVPNTSHTGILSIIQQVYCTKQRRYNCDYQGDHEFQCEGAKFRSD